MALDAPHLVASFRLVDAHMAFGAWSRVVPQHLDCIDVVLLAFVIGGVPINPLVLVAVRAEEVFAHSTLVGSRELPTTIIRRTRHEEFAPLLDDATMRPSQVIIKVLPTLTEVAFSFVNRSFRLFHYFLECLLFDLELGVLLVLSETALGFR